MVKKMMDDILSTPVEARQRRLKLEAFDEMSAIKDASSLVSKEVNDAQIIIHFEDDSVKYDPKSKAKMARPFKPAIYME
jgi:leucyl-tRNA synthetase